VSGQGARPKCDDGDVTLPGDIEHLTSETFPADDIEEDTAS
jgi:hypothetical protein